MQGWTYASITNMGILSWCNHNSVYFRIGIFIISLVPFIHAFSSWYLDELGINPFEALMSISGITAFSFLGLTLCITPFRRWFRFMAEKLKANYGKRLSDWNFLIRSRRMLGLFCFFYTTLHGIVYLYFEINLDWQELLFDLYSRYFITFGMVAWCIGFVLAITSPINIRKKLGKYWRRIQRGIYLMAILAMLHLWMVAKLPSYFEWFSFLIIFILLGHRLVTVINKRSDRFKDDGLETNR